MESIASLFLFVSGANNLCQEVSERRAVLARIGRILNSLTIRSTIWPITGAQLAENVPDAIGYSKQ